MSRRISSSATGHPGDSPSLYPGGRGAESGAQHRFDLPEGCPGTAEKKTDLEKISDHRQSVKYLGVPRYRYGLAEERNAIGLATGLAWTEVGGELLQIETILMPGNGKLTMTGKLGDVMQESAHAALCYVRSRAMRLGLAPDFYQKIDIHIHVPEGAIPKDGPSAGITMATSMVSALLKMPVNKEIAMTGEITLRGRVLPIGGLTEKLLAARRGNISHVLIPKENERDLREVPPRIRSSLQIDLVENVDEVLQAALLVRKGEELFRDIPFESIFKDFTVSSHNTPAH